MLKNIKSVLAVIVAAVMLFSAAGCSGNNGDTSLENSRDGLLDANVSEAFQKPDAPETENQTVES